MSRTSSCPAIDPDAALAEIEAHFGDWAARTRPSDIRADPARRPAGRPRRPPGIGPERAAGRPPGHRPRASALLRGHRDGGAPGRGCSAAASTAGCARSSATRTAPGARSTRVGRRVRSPRPRRSRPRSPPTPSASSSASSTDATDSPAEDKLAEVRDFLVGVFPLRFESTTGIAAAIEPLAVYGLPNDYWQTYRANVESGRPPSPPRRASSSARPRPSSSSRGMPRGARRHRGIGPRPAGGGPGRLAEELGQRRDEAFVLVGGARGRRSQPVIGPAS